MSNRMQDFIELWNKKRSLKTLTSSDIADIDPESLRTELMNMDNVQRTEAKEALEDISEMLVKRISKLKEKRTKLYEKIALSKKTKTACLAYQKQEQMSPTYKEEKAESSAHKRTKLYEREKQLRKNLKTAGKVRKDSNNNSGK